MVTFLIIKEQLVLFCIWRTGFLYLEQSRSLYPAHMLSWTGQRLLSVTVLEQKHFKYKKSFFCRKQALPSLG